MRAFILLPIALFFASKILAQNQGPVFENKNDSMMFAPFDASIRRAFETDNYKIADSLIQARNRFLTTHKHIMRTMYRQDGTYTPYQRLWKINNKDSITKISVIGNGKRRLPDSLYLYRNLSELELIDFRLSKLPKKLLANKSFKKLTIYNNLPSKRLKLPKNSSITNLSIRGDEKGMLPKSYRKFKKLEVLLLSRNNLKEVPRTTRAQNLKRLDLTFNSITSIPSWISEFNNLVALNLNNNNVSVIDRNIEKLSQLQELSLYKNNLSEFPSVLYSMKSLRVIDLYYNHIPKIMSDIGNLKNLEILYLANNGLFSVPNEIGDLTNLRELYLHHNKLSNLPSLGKLSSLNILRINNNNLIEWPEGLKDLKALGNLDCSFNQFESLPIGELEFSNMKILSLGGNPWDANLKDNMLEWIEALRAKNVVVHIDERMMREY